MNQYERDNVEQIKNEMKAYEEKNGKMSKEKKAYYIYRRMGQCYSYKEAFFLYSNAKQEYDDRINIYREGTTEEGEATCVDMNRSCVDFMREEGINANLYFMNTRDPLSHADGGFEVDGKYYFFNLTSDVMRIQTGMRTRNFGISQKRIAEKLYNQDPKKNRIDHLIRMNEQNEGKNFSEIPQKLIEEWDNEFGFTYKGLYTNDILDMMKEESFDKKFMEEFFETKQPDELVQRKFEFIMKYVGIIGANRKRKVGNIEAKEYYIKLSSHILTKEEIKNYIEMCKGFIERDGRRQGKNIVVIKKENENIYYLYNSEKQIYERIEKEALIKQGIQYIHEKTGMTLPIETYIKEKEERFEKVNEVGLKEIEI